MKADALPSGAWERLFPRALALIDEIGKYGGVADPFWTLGGGLHAELRPLRGGGR